MSSRGGEKERESDELVDFLTSRFVTFFAGVVVFLKAAVDVCAAVTTAGTLI